MARGSDPDRFVTIGRVVKPHGIRGELVVDFYGDSPVLFDDLDGVYVRAGEGLEPQRREIASWREHKGRPLLALAGVADRDQAELLRGFELMVTVDDLPELAADEVYLRDLPGCEVYLENGTLLGRLESFLAPMDQEVWIIRSHDGREILLPANEEFVASIDIKARRIVAAPPPGLLDLYLDDAGEAPE